MPRMKIGRRLLHFKNSHDAGKTSFSAFTKFAVGTEDSVTNVTTCASACTPASVRPSPAAIPFRP
jgi:hypothetical protein